MVERTSPPLSLAELECVLRDADPSAFLVPPRILRRVIKEDRGVRFLGWHASHRDRYVISGTALRASVTPEELGLRPTDPWPESTILLARPDPEGLAVSPRAEVLLEYWRKLFYARVQVAIDRRFAEGWLTEVELRDRIERIGRVEFDEIRAVLRQDGYLLPPLDDQMVYREFAAVFLELFHFAPALLPHDFPAIDDPASAALVLADDVDAASLRDATRLAGAPSPGHSPIPEEEVPGGEPEAAEGDPWKTEPPQGLYRWLNHRAEGAAARGNLVRAAILRTQAARRAGPALGRRARAGARGELERLSRRLQAALGFDDAELDRWRRALPVLLDRSARGYWMPEARLLFDLQKVCNDHEREVFTIDLVEWVRSLGRRPLKRPLPRLREVMISNHLRRAARRLPSARLPRDDRERLHGLLHTAVARAEEALRDRFRHTIDATLKGEGVHPRNLPERVAYQKLIEELLDKVIERGFLTLGGLRDACSRSNLKIPDLAGPLEFVRGDRLLRTDSTLAEELDGVYRRGEIYLRLLQRFSSLAFASPWGRFLTLYVALPFGGAFVGLEGLKHLVHMVSRVEVDFAQPPTLVFVGAVALGLINFPGFRRQFEADLRRIGRALRAVLYDFPAWLVRQPIVRVVIESRIFTALWRFALKPLLVIAPFWVLGWLAGLEWRGTIPTSAIGFVALSLLINSRLGRDVEEIIADRAARLWRRFWLELIPGLFRWIILISQRFLETVERLIYAVDEWLRFRSGQRRGSLVIKAVLGFVWFFVAYLVRIYVNVLIEPQVNPIKHFPVVTVSHKIILPLSKTLTLWIATPLMPLGRWAAYSLAATTVLLLPGAFGFLVWELKENWKLYEANRPESLQPVIVGHHGETLSRLLRPGFHSGTLPKLFAKLRKSERRALKGGRDQGMHRHRETLHHVEHEIRRFLERDFVALLRGSGSLGPLGIEVGVIALATNRIRAEFRAPDELGARFGIEFVERAGTFTAGAARPGCLPILTEPQRRALALAIHGLYQMSGADRVSSPILDEGNRGDTSLPLIEPAPPLGGWADSKARQVLSPRVAVTWERWVELWEAEQGAPPSDLPCAGSVPVSPAVERKA